MHLKYASNALRFPEVAISVAGVYKYCHDNSYLD